MPAPTFDFSDSGAYVKLIVTIIVSLMNYFEIVYIVRKDKKTSYEVLLLSLSVSDALFTTTNLMPAFIDDPTDYNPLMLNIMQYIYSMSFFLSMFHLIGLAVDRLVAVRFPFQHRTYWRVRYTFLLAVFFWLFSILTFVFLRVYKHTVGQLYHLKQLKICIVTVVGLTDFSLFIVYTIIFLHLKKISKSKAKTFNCTQHKQNKGPLILCVLTAVLFIVLTVQLVIEALTSLDQFFWVSSSASFLLILNAGLNSFVYFFCGKLIVYIRRRKTRKINKKDPNSGES